MSKSEQSGFENTDLGASVFGDNPVRAHDHLYLTAPPEREKSSYKQLISHLLPRINEMKINRKKVRLCDVGCATGDFLRYAAENLTQVELFGLDYLPALIDRARLNYPGYSFRVGSVLEQKTFDSDSLDIVTALGVLCIFDDPLPALRNIHFWLRKKEEGGGVLAIFQSLNSDDIDVWLRFAREPKQAKLETGWNFFSVRTMSGLCEEAGFRDIEIMDFKVDFKRPPQVGDPMRAWTTTVGDVPLLLNGAGVVQTFKFLLART